MARIQVLPLPPLKAGEYEQTPFILIFDKVTDDEPISQAFTSWLEETTGAAAIIVTPDTIDAPGELKLTDEQRDELLAYVTQPHRIMLGVSQTMVDSALAHTYGTIPQTFTTSGD